MMRIAFLVLLLAAVPLTSAHAKRECYEGTATINQQHSGANCTTQEKEYSNSSVGPKTHPGCSAAKKNARILLSARVQDSCKPYIQTFSRCHVVKIKRCS